MCRPHPRLHCCILFALVAVLVVSVLGTGRVTAQNITEIIDAFGDGADSFLNGAFGIAVDVTGNAYVVGGVSQNAFKITPAGVITEIIAVDAAGNAYVTGVGSDNAFKITLDEDDDGVRNEIDVCPNTPAGLPVACDGRPLRDCNVDCLFDSDDIQCIVDELLNQ